MSKVFEHYLHIEIEKGYEPIITSYVIDDGWNLPVEVVERIDLKIQESYLQEMRRLKTLHNEHKGDWLTMDVARKYEAKSWIYRVLYDYQNIHQVREIERELQELYGVTELEAVNILNGHNVKDYVEKYHRIQYLIPAAINAQEICDDLVDEYFEMVG